MTADILHAKELAEAGDLDPAWKIVNQVLSENTNDSRGLLLLTFILEKAGRVPEAYHIAKRFCDIYPGEPAGWINVGRCCDVLWKIEEGEAAYRKAVSCAREDKLRMQAYNNLAALYIQTGRFREAKPYAERALVLEPESGKAKHNLGMCLLAERNWADGWPLYSASVGSANRIAWRYGDEDEWDGTPGKTVVIHGEQGLGDEICAASMFNDAIAKSGKIILDCDARLTNLYRRSFPKARVYGTRKQKMLTWAAEDQNIDASISAMELGKLFRLKDEDFAVEPYIKPDHERVTMWRALFDQKNKPVIGIAWSGGVPQTAAHKRKLTLNALLPLFETIDAHWVSLQYRDAQSEIEEFRASHPKVDIKQYPHATLTNDYDDTAGIVASCDLIVTVPTAVMHLAGAMGVPTIVMKSAYSCWKLSGGLLFHQYNMRLIDHSRKEGWEEVIQRTAKAIHDRYATRIHWLRSKTAVSV